MIEYSKTTSSIIVNLIKILIKINVENYQSIEILYVLFSMLIIHNEISENWILAVV